MTRTIVIPNRAGHDHTSVIHLNEYCCGFINGLSAANGRAAWKSRWKDSLMYLSAALVRDQNRDDDGKGLRSPCHFRATVHIQGYGAAIILVPYIPKDRFFRLDHWVLWRYPNVRLLLFDEIAPSILYRGLGEIISPARFANVEKQSEKSKKFKDNFPPLKALLAFLFGFLFVGWGWAWWKGLYYHPDGTAGYTLASIACIIGVAFWWVAMNWWVPF